MKIFKSDNVSSLGGSSEFLHVPTVTHAGRVAQLFQLRMTLIYPHKYSTSSGILL